MRARSAVFDLYGDDLSSRGQWAPVAALVGVLASCRITPAATRTAVSRMVAQGWLAAEVRHDLRGYAARPAMRERLAGAHARIYRRGPVGWDGRWHLLTLQPAGDRRTRDQVAATLSFLGYGRLAGQTWVAPHHSDEAATQLGRLGVAVQEFSGEHAGDPVDLAAGVWDLGTLAADYRRFSVEADEVRRSLPRLVAPDLAYPARAALVHRWRTFLFADPGLPAAVLPHDWPEPAARAVFLDVADALAPQARTFVSRALATAGVPSAHLQESR